MALLLAVAVCLLGVCIMILQAQNKYLRESLAAWKASAEPVDIGTVCDEYLSPTSHNVPDIDPDQIMAGSDDPVWDLVIDCRSVGIMNEWLVRHPQVAAQQPHRQYGEFATYILQLPEHQRNVSGIRLAVTGRE